MISIYSQRKRSEHGAALIMLVSIIGLAFVVTVAAFLVAASNSQDTARLASAKVDVATREDALMRVILQQTATGMLPGTDGVTGTPQPWTTIMTNAVTQLRATTYVDPAELAALPGLSGVIPDNMGDTAGTSLGIFQGYNAEVPFGGTSGLGNVVSPYNGTVQPPLLGWTGNATLSSATALTTPQEFFLGSQYTSTSTPVTTDPYSKRWGQINYPNIRFGYKQPGDQFFARRVWWRIPLVYQTAQTLQTQAGVLRYPSAPANYVLSVYEIPSQLPISGNANLKIGQNADGTAWGSGNISVAGSIYGGQIQLSGGTYNKGISSRKQVNVLSAATVSGVAYSNNTFDDVGTRETMALTQATPGAAPVSVAGNDGKVLLVPVMPGNQFYMSVASPTHWDLYARPYYRCRIRIIISGTTPTLIYTPQMTTAPNPAAISVQVIVLADSSSFPDQILGFLDSAATSTTYSQALLNWPLWMTYTSTGTGTGVPPAGSDRNILIINVGNMIAALGIPTQLYSIYVGSNPTTEPASPSTTSDPGVGIIGANDLSAFTSGLSIVSNQTIYLLDAFNQGATKPATSIFAPDVRYGISGVTPSTTAITGQISIDPASTSSVAGSPLTFADEDGTLISTSSASNTFSLLEMPNLTSIPPITRLTLMFTVERERTN
jgi:hypothetical protein